MFYVLLWPDSDQIMPVAMLYSTHIYLEYFYVGCGYMHFLFDVSKPCRYYYQWLTNLDLEFIFFLTSIQKDLDSSPDFLDL